MPPRRDITDEIIEIRNGWYYPSDRPGLGVNFKEDSVSKHPFVQVNYPPEIKDDGSIALN